MSHTVTINWTASVDAVQSYNVYRSTVSGAEIPPFINSAPITADTYTDIVPSPGIYYYVVTSVENGAESVHSAEISAAVLPFPPTNVVLGTIV